MRGTQLTVVVTTGGVLRILLVSGDPARRLRFNRATNIVVHCKTSSIHNACAVINTDRNAPTTNTHTFWLIALLHFVIIKITIGV